MGLTIHYSITAPANWTPAVIRAKLEETRQFAKTLPVVSVSVLAEFCGADANFQHVRDAGLEDKDDFFWSKIQAQRSILNPCEPGCHGSQPPNRLIVFSLLPAEGCEQMNIGSCWYPRYVWKARRDDNRIPAWSLVFDRRNHYPASRKVMLAFVRRWNLRRLPKSKCSVSERFGSSVSCGCFARNGLAQANVRKGRYLSHRRGYSGDVGIVTIRDRMVFELAFRYKCTAEEAKKVFASPEFKADLDRMVVGQDHVTPAASGIWSSFCKTQYANSPECGGWNNFAKAHLSVLAILEHLQKLGFEVTVRDEGEFWETKDLKVLAKSVGDYDALIAGMAGALKDIAAAKGMTAESAMDGRSDFERLEMKAQTGQIGEFVKKLTGAS